MPSDQPKLDDGDRALLRECPFGQWVPKKPTRATAARLKRIHRLTLLGHLCGRVKRKDTDGYAYDITLTSAGRVALGLPPDAPVP
jgi:hypothetical protein